MIKQTNAHLEGPLLGGLGQSTVSLDCICMFVNLLLETLLPQLLYQHLYRQQPSLGIVLNITDGVCIGMCTAASKCCHQVFCIHTFLLSVSGMRPESLVPYQTASGCKALCSQMAQATSRWSMQMFREVNHYVFTMCICTRSQSCALA